ncbi:unnamed protein product [Brassica oleracea]
MGVVPLLSVELLKHLDAVKLSVLGFPASRVIPLGPVRQRSTSPGRALPGLDRTQYRFGVQKRQGSFRMGREPGWWLPPQTRPATWTTSSEQIIYNH